MSFAVADDTAENSVIFEPYIIKSSISIAANLREAFRKSTLLMRNYNRAMVMIDTPVVLIPIEEYSADDQETLYHHTFSGHENDAILSNVIPNLNAVAVYPINKDLKLVIDDHFKDVKTTPIMQPVWKYLHGRSFTGLRSKLYVYFHDKTLDVFSFNKNRFKYCNSFNTNNAKDSVYFMLNVWKQLALDPEKDELHIVGDITEREWMLEELKLYVQKTYVINPIADFNRSPITQVKGMPLDMITLFIKGR